jgi:hypothetical protein
MIELLPNRLIFSLATAKPHFLAILYTHDCGIALPHFVGIFKGAHLIRTQQIGQLNFEWLQAR